MANKRSTGEAEGEPKPSKKKRGANAASLFADLGEKKKEGGASRV